uniref:Long-chain-fatty-acid--CoA ligase n=1 Tax=Parastrongyloides trichosuri TaxID=131310 RepID=A0A0N5A5Z3_PARTI
MLPDRLGRRGDAGGPGRRPSLHAGRPVAQPDGRLRQAGARNALPSEPPEPVRAGRHCRRVLGDLREPPRLSVAAGDRGGAGAGGSGAGDFRHSRLAGGAGRHQQCRKGAGAGDRGGHQVRLRLPGGRGSALRCGQRERPVHLRLQGAAADPGDLGPVGPAVALEDPEVDHPGLRLPVPADDGAGRRLGAGGGGQRLSGHDRKPHRHPRLSGQADPFGSLSDDGGGSGHRRRFDHGGLCDHPVAGAQQCGGPRPGRVHRLGSGRGHAGARHHPGEARRGRGGGRLQLGAEVRQRRRRHRQGHVRRPDGGAEHLGRADRLRGPGGAGQHHSGRLRHRRRSADGRAHPGLAVRPCGLADRRGMGRRPEGGLAAGGQADPDRVRRLHRAGQGPARRHERAHPDVDDLCAVRFRQHRLGRHHRHRPVGADARASRGGAGPGMEGAVRRLSGDPDDRLHRRGLARRRLHLPGLPAPGRGVRLLHERQQHPAGRQSGRGAVAGGGRGGRGAGAIRAGRHARRPGRGRRGRAVAQPGAGGRGPVAGRSRRGGGGGDSACGHRPDGHGDGRRELGLPARRRGWGQPDLYDGNARQDRPRPGGGGPGRRSVGVPALYGAVGRAGRRRAAGRRGLWPPGTGRPVAGGGRRDGAGAGRAAVPRLRPLSERSGRPLLRRRRRRHLGRGHRRSAQGHRIRSGPEGRPGSLGRSQPGHRRGRVPLEPGRRASPVQSGRHDGSDRRHSGRGPRRRLSGREAAQGRRQADHHRRQPGQPGSRGRQDRRRDRGSFCLAGSVRPACAGAVARGRLHGSFEEVRHRTPGRHPWGGRGGGRRPGRSHAARGAGAGRLALFQPRPARSLGDQRRPEPGGHQIFLQGRRLDPLRQPRRSRHRAPDAGGQGARDLGQRRLRTLRQSVGAGPDRVPAEPERTARAAGRAGAHHHVDARHRLGPRPHHHAPARDVPGGRHRSDRRRGRGSVGPRPDDRSGARHPQRRGVVRAQPEAGQGHGDGSGQPHPGCGLRRDRLHLRHRRRRQGLDRGADAGPHQGYRRGRRRRRGRARPERHHARGRASGSPGYGPAADLLRPAPAAEDRLGTGARRRPRPGRGQWNPRHRARHSTRRRDPAGRRAHAGRSQRYGATHRHRPHRGSGEGLRNPRRSCAPGCMKPDGGAAGFKRRGGRRRQEADGARKGGRRSSVSGRRAHGPMAAARRRGDQGSLPGHGGAGQRHRRRGRRGAGRIRLRHRRLGLADGLLRADAASAGLLHAFRPGRGPDGGDPRSRRPHHVGQARQCERGRARQLSEERIPADGRGGPVQDQAGPRLARADGPARGLRPGMCPADAAHGAGAARHPRQDRTDPAQRVHVQPGAHVQARQP